MLNSGGAVAQVRVGRAEGGERAQRARVKLAEFLQGAEARDALLEQGRRLLVIVQGRVQGRHGEAALRGGTLAVREPAERGIGGGEHLGLQRLTQ